MERVNDDKPTWFTEDVLHALVKEYRLRHVSETEEEHVGRRNAIRGVAVRLGIYSIFCERADE